MAGLKELAAEAGVDADLVSRFVDAIGKALERGDRVIIRGLGTFDRKFCPEREFDTAVMDQPVVKPARFKVSFKASEMLLSRLPVPGPNAGT